MDTEVQNESQTDSYSLRRNAERQSRGMRPPYGYMDAGTFLAHIAGSHGHAQHHAALHHVALLQRAAGAARYIHPAIRAAAETCGRYL